MLRSTLLITLVSVGSYLISFANQVIIAKIFGASTELDAYLVATTFPFFLMTVTAGLFSFTLVPMLVRIRFNEPQYYQTTTVLLTSIVLVALLTALVGYFISPVVARLTMPGYPESLRAASTTMMRISWVTCAITMIINYLGSIYNAAKKFFMPVLANMCYYFGMMLGIVLFAQQLGVLALVLGLLAGNLIALPILFSGIRHHFVIRPTKWHWWRQILVVLRPMPLVLVSIVCISIYSSMDTFWATRLGQNNLSYLGYGQRTIFALANLITLGPMTVILPYLSESIAHGHPDRFRAQILRAVRMLLYFSSLAALTVSILSVPIVTLLFERGAFNKATTLVVSSITAGLTPGMVAMASVVFLFRGFYAIGDFAGAARISAAGAALYFFLSGLLSNAIGLQGIIAAYDITWFVLLLWSVIRLWRGYWKEMWNGHNLDFLWHLALGLGVSSVFIMLSGAWLVQPALDSSVFDLGVRLSATIALGFTVFFIITAAGFKMREVTFLLELLPPLRIHNRIQKVIVNRFTALRCVKSGGSREP